MESKELDDTILEQIKAGMNPSSEAFEKQKEFLNSLKSDLRIEKDELTEEELSKITTVSRTR